MCPSWADIDHGRELALQAAKEGITLPVHVKIDTGMGRIGMPWRQAEQQIMELAAESSLNIHGACSHFAMVEDSEPQAARQQVERFRTVTQAVERRLGRELFKHLSSSRAILQHGEWDFNGIRPGHHAVWLRGAG